MKLYEALFLIEAGRAAREWEQTEGELLGILEKHGGSVREKARYDERKLAYPVKGARRGAYLLVYFEAEPPAIAEIHADLNLSEVVLRTMILAIESGEVPELPTLGTADPREGPPPSSSDDEDEDEDEADDEDDSDDEDEAGDEAEKEEE